LGNSGIYAYGSSGITAVYNIISNRSLRTGAAGGRDGDVHFELLSSSGEPSGMTLMPMSADYNDTLYLPHETGANRKDTIATLSGNQNFTDMGGIFPDSIRSATVSYILYSQTITDAGAVNNDTSNYATTVWIQDTTRTANLEYRRKAKFLYVHKSGIKNITAYYQGKVSAVDLQSGKTQIFVKTMAEATATSTTSAGITNTSYAAKTLSIDVSGLTTNTPYYIEFRMLNLETANNYTTSVKDAVFYAESQ